MIRSMLLLILSLPALADVHIMHCPFGCPENPASNDLLIKHSYALSNNPTTKFADWVAYEVDVRNFGDSPGRTWKADPDLEDSETLEPNDYKGASTALKIDRGHQAPLATFAGSMHWIELNQLSNITPQRSDLNQGAWVALETAIRDASIFRSSVFVITGPVYETQQSDMPNADESHKVPSGYFKIAYNQKGGVGFLMDQDTPRSTDYCSTIKSLSTISNKVLFKLPSIPESTQMKSRLGC
jgi:endonuclease G